MDLWVCIVLDTAAAAVPRTENGWSVGLVQPSAAWLGAVVAYNSLVMCLLASANQMIFLLLRLPILCSASGSQAALHSILWKINFHLLAAVVNAFHVGRHAHPMLWCRLTDITHAKHALARSFNLRHNTRHIQMRRGNEFFCLFSLLIRSAVCGFTIALSQCLILG